MLTGGTGDQYRLMSTHDKASNKTTYLGATYTVPITDLFNATTGAKRTPAVVDIGYLKAMTHLNVVSGSGTGPYVVDYPGYKLGQVGFLVFFAALCNCCC